MSSQNKSDEHAQVEDHITRRYDLQEFKGKGAYGIVWKAVDKKTKQVVALKKVFDAFQNSTDAQRTYREVVFLQQLNHHENIVKLHNVVRSENNKDLYMVFEYMETDLHKVIRANLLNMLHKQYIIYQLLKCLKYIHSGDLIHRDLKPSNLLIDSECQIKVADFGLARSVAMSENDDENPVLTEYVATRWYRAPEILFGSHKYSKAVDMWSVGCILGEMVAGKAIFSGTSTLNQIEKVIELLGRPKPEDLDSINALLANQILSNITTQKKRSFAQFFQGMSDDAVDFLRNLLVFNPNNRMTVDEALNHRFMKDFRGTEDEKIMQDTVSIPFNDNKKYTIKDYREALYQGLTQKKKGERQELQTLHNTVLKQQLKQVHNTAPQPNQQHSQTQGENNHNYTIDESQQQIINRSSNKVSQSQSFHSQQVKEPQQKVYKEIKDDFMSQTQSGVYSTSNGKPMSAYTAIQVPYPSQIQYLNQKSNSQGFKKYAQNSTSKQLEDAPYIMQKSYSQVKGDSNEKTQLSTNALHQQQQEQAFEEIPTVHKNSLYSKNESAQPTATENKDEGAFYKPKKPNGYMSEDHSKENSRSISQSEQNQRANQILADAQYNFNNFNNNKALYQKYTNNRQNSQSNTFLMQRQSKSHLPYEVIHKASHSSNPNGGQYYVKTPDLNNYQTTKQQTFSTGATPYRSKSYEKQSQLKVTPSQFIERSNSKQQPKMSVNSPFASESKSTSNAHSRQKTSVDRQSKNNLNNIQSGSFVVRNDRQITQPATTTAVTAFSTSLNSVQKLLAKVTNPNYGNAQTTTKKNSYANATYTNAAQYQPKKTHNKSNSFVDAQQPKITSNVPLVNSFNYNYFEKQMQVRNSSFKGVAKFK